MTLGLSRFNSKRLCRDPVIELTRMTDQGAVLEDEMEFFLLTLGVCTLTTAIIQSSPPIAKRRLERAETLGLKKLDIWGPTIFSIIGFISLTTHILITWQ